MCVNDLSKVALDSAAAGIEPTTSSRKFNALTTAPPSQISSVPLTRLHRGQHVPVVEAGRDQVLQDVDEVDRRNLGDRVTSVHCTHHVDAAVLIDSDENAT